LRERLQCVPVASIEVEYTFIEVAPLDHSTDEGLLPWIRSRFMAPSKGDVPPILHTRFKHNSVIFQVYALTGLLVISKEGAGKTDFKERRDGLIGEQSEPHCRPSWRCAPQDPAEGRSATRGQPHVIWDER